SKSHSRSVLRHSSPSAHPPYFRCRWTGASTHRITVSRGQQRLTRLRVPFTPPTSGDDSTRLRSRSPSASTPPTPPAASRARACAPRGAGRARRRVLHSGAAHRIFTRTRKAFLEIQDCYPFRLYDDASHLGKHRGDLCHPCATLLRTKVSLRRHCILRYHAGDVFNVGRAPDLQ